MRHAEQDAHDARARARRLFSGEWHPILAAVEVRPGEWRMRAPDDTCYGVIRWLELGGEHGYRAVTWAPRSEDRELIGYYRTLRAAVEAAHRNYLARHGRDGGINGR